MTMTEHTTTTDRIETADTPRAHARSRASGAHDRVPAEGRGRTPTTARAGFTMIEVMLAISVLALLMAMAWGSYNTASRNQQRMADINARLHGVEQAMNRMVRELSMAYMTTHGQEESQQEIRYKTGFLGEDDRIDFTTLSNVRMFRDDKVSDQVEISYYVKRVRNDDGDLVPSLVRREDAPVDDEFDEGGIVMTMLEDVKEFEVEYWDDEKADVAAGADGWVEDWDTEDGEYENRLPSRVRITVVIQDPANRNEDMTLVTQAEIHMTKAIGF